MYTDPSGNVEVYGNETDIAIAMRILGADNGYNYHITTASDHLTSYDLDPGSIIVGGVHTRGGVGGEENPSNGVLRLWGADRDATADAIRAYKKSIDRIEEGMTGTAKSPTISKQSIDLTFREMNSRAECSMHFLRHTTVLLTHKVRNGNLTLKTILLH